MTRAESRGYDLAVETLINAAESDLSRDRAKLLWVAAYLKGRKPAVRGSMLCLIWRWFVAWA